MNTKRINRMLNLVVIIVLMLAWQPVTSATATALPGAPATQRLPVETVLNSDGTLNTRTGASGALDVRDWNVTLDSARGPILTRDTPALPNTDIYSALAHNGLNNHVNAIAVMGSDVYVGGDFTQTADGAVTLNYIAKYSGGTWSALANNGLNLPVYALAVIGNDLYVGGDFIKTADGAVTLNAIAKYSGDTWSALAHNGLCCSVYAFAVMGSDLYVGGGIVHTADEHFEDWIFLNAIAKYSGGAWSALANTGLNSSVRALAVIGSDLYVGGNFWITGDIPASVFNLNHIARYSGGAWLPLAHNGLNGDPVQALAVIGSDLYVGGVFDKTADGAVTDLNDIAKYSDGAWSPLAHDGLNNVVYALAVSGSDLYAGGSFSQTADGLVNNMYGIAEYSGGVWSAFAHGGVIPHVFALAVSGSDLYAGGAFTQTTDGAVNLNYIAKVSPGYACYLPLAIK